ncbi:MAG: hypothetical protein OEV66_09785 [Spirochaetia bacterium]|nr:hypothetical protein [Spirochaetia bacterium]
MEPENIYGDKYDLWSGLFLESYRPGASINGLNENEDVYTIAEDVKEILDLTGSVEGRKKFLSILRQYDPGAKLPAENIETFISRRPGYREHYWDTDYDVNRDYRLYDHLDLLNQEPVEGLISNINKLKPQLVVSLHLTGGNPDKNGGMSAVISPGYDTYRMAIDYVKGDNNQKKVIESKFKKSSYSNWFISQHGRSSFEWFLCDSWIYFTGYWSLVDGLKADEQKFRGFRQNMITWKYRDEKWNGARAAGVPNTPYASDLKYFYPSGAFWQREQGDAEKWKREGGLEGYGGDNFYASQEILRFLRKGLLIHGIYNRWNLPRIVEPYISTWSVPVYVNAISAYIELAYLDNRKDFDRIYRYKKVHAEAIAVAIYSIFYGSSARSSRDDQPRGEPIDFGKYETYDNTNYFTIVR